MRLVLLQPQTVEGPEELVLIEDATGCQFTDETIYGPEGRELANWTYFGTRGDRSYTGWWPKPRALDGFDPPEQVYARVEVRP